MWAWLLFRISGLAVVIYLVTHIIVISQARVNGADSLDTSFRLFDHPLFILLDLLLVGALLYHAFTGVRVVLMDLGVGIRRHKVVFLTLVALALVSLSFFAVKAFQFLGQS